MQKHTVRKLRATSNQTLDVTANGGEVQISQGKHPLLLSLAPQKTLIEHELDIEVPVDE